jgi:hypothetical protein
MHDVVRVRVGQGRGDLAQDSNRFRQRELRRSPSRTRSDSPSTNGIVKYGTPSSSPAERSGTT